jgi:uncharacterized protein YndB with AHSA1/START domain
MAEVRTERTLVKSPPELWELVDDVDLMRRWAAEICGGAADGPLEIDEREPEERLVWSCSDGPRIELTLAEKGWGTNVSIEAACGEASANGADVLESLLDELGSPTKRPFARS